MTSRDSVDRTQTRNHPSRQQRMLYASNHAQLALVVLCFRNFRLQSCVIKQTTV